MVSSRSTVVMTSSRPGRHRAKSFHPRTLPVSGTDIPQLQPLYGIRVPDVLNALPSRIERPNDMH